MANEQKPIWYLPGPNFQYVEDVKALAREAGLRIIDANTTTDRSNAAENPPEVTLKATGTLNTDPTERMFDAARRELESKYNELRQMRDDLVLQRERLDEQAATQEAERARLAALAEKLAADLAAVALQSAGAPEDDTPPQGSSPAEPKAPRAPRAK